MTIGLPFTTAVLVIKWHSRNVDCRYSYCYAYGRKFTQSQDRATCPDVRVASVCLFLYPSVCHVSCPSRAQKWTESQKFITLLRHQSCRVTCGVNSTDTERSSPSPPQLRYEMYHNWQRWRRKHHPNLVPVLRRLKMQDWKWRTGKRMTFAWSNTGISSATTFAE